MALPEHIDKLLEESNNTQEEPISKGAVLIRDPTKRRKCPICYHNLHLYHMNFEEMFLMCENSYCEFPFGYEALQIVRNESELRHNPEKSTRDFFEYPVAEGNHLPCNLDSILGAPTCSVSSMSCFSDSDRLSQASEPEELTIEKQDIIAARLTRQDSKRREQEQTNKDVQSSLTRIKKLTEEMSKLQSTPQTDSTVIKNKKWLRNIKLWEVETRQRLLQKKENKEAEEFKISVNPSPDNGSPAVNIQIMINKPHDEGAEQ